MPKLIVYSFNVDCSESKVHCRPELMASPADTQEEEEQHFSYAMQLVSSGALPMVLLSAFRLEIFEIIAKEGPGAQLSPTQIASQLTSSSSSSKNKNPEAVFMVDRMLRLLASHSILTCSIIGEPNNNKNNNDDGILLPRVYGLAPVAKYFVRDSNLGSGGASLGSFLALVQDKVFNASWYALEDAVLEGGVPFNRFHGTHVFEYPKQDPRFNEVINQAMIGNSAISVTRIIESYKGFEHMKKLVDVGGGLGITISKIVSMYPNTEGINFDLPHVVQHAPAYSGVQHVGGDMFESVPEGDAIFMKYILHDWDDASCLKLLKNCYSSLPDNGKVIVAESLLPVNPNTSSSVKAICQLDLVMMTQSPGGKERSEHEFMALATESGFKGIKKACFVCNLWIMEFYK